MRHKSRTAWATLVGVFCIICFFAFRVPHLVILSQRAHTTIGSVAAVDRLNHASVEVQYTIGGRHFQGTFAPYYLNRGQTVTVYYDPDGPDAAEIEKPSGLLRKNLEVSTLGSLLFASVMALSIFVPVPWWRRPAWVSIKPRWTITGAVTLTFTVVILNWSRGRNLDDGRMWISDVCVLLGTLLVLARALQANRDAGWAVVLRSKLIVAGVSLIILGQSLRGLVQTLGQ